MEKPIRWLCEIVKTLNYSLHKRYFFKIKIKFYSNNRSLPFVITLKGILDSLFELIVKVFLEQLVIPLISPEHSMEFVFEWLLYQFSVGKLRD